MLLVMIITYYSQSPLSLHYTEEELYSKIKEYVSNESQSYFTYFQLCDSLLKKAEIENKLGKKQNTIYSNPKLNPKDYTRISVILWRLIREGLICIDFYVNPYRGVTKDDTTFIIVEK